MFHTGGIQHRSSYSQGFSLVELSVVLVIISVIISMVVSVGFTRIETQRIKTTKERLHFIMASLDHYVRTYSHLPCPADPTALLGTVLYGDGVGTNTGAGGCTASNLLSEGTNNVHAGAVPTVQLGLVDAVAIDGWDQRFTYVVDEDLTFYDNTDATGYTLSTNIGEIAIQNTLGTELIPDSDITDDEGAAVLVISHGPNGHGAWPGKGGSTRITVSGVAAIEQENAHTAGGFDHEFVHTFPNKDIDDLLDYRMRWQLGQ